MQTVAIIPARGGSKGVPGKNWIPLLSKPLIGYTIEAALKSKLLDGVIVSSDDERIHEIVSLYQGVIYHNRSAVLASDTSPVLDTVEDILKTVQQARKADAVMLLQPTSPIRTSEQIDKAISIIIEHPEANSLISVCPMRDVHPARMYWIENGLLSPVLPYLEQSRRQDIPVAYFRNGSIYITRRVSLEKHKKIMVKPTVGYIMPASWLLNIDEPRDIIIAEALIKAWMEERL